MKWSKFFYLSILALGMNPAFVQARPIFTESAATAGKLTFDANILMSVREDTFGSPTTKYQTVHTPWQARIGFNPKLDVGFMLDYVSQRLEQNGARYDGSGNNLLSPFFKFNPWQNVGLLVYWHTKHSAKDNEDLPVARGDDLEAIALYSAPTKWPLTFNVGYVLRDPYNSKFGVAAAETPIHVHPGDIFEAKGSLETPLPAHFSILSELAYYHVDSQTNNSEKIQGSKGDAIDALIGLSWDYKAWYLSTGSAFGLLNESHTSFDLYRGAGDYQIFLRIGYKLLPLKSNS